MEKKTTPAEIMANMTKGEWHYTWDDNDFYFIWSDNPTCPRPYIVASGKNCDRDGFNVEAITTAVNGTYGIGVNPDAVEGLYNALLNIQGIEAFITDHKMKKLFQDTVYPAIKKAKL